jgi:hypothetical protein
MPVTIASTGGNVIEISTGTGTITTNVVAIARVRWVSSAAAQNDGCVLKDTAGNIIFESFATGADWIDEVEMGKVPPVLGLQLTTFASGHLYIYLR